MRNETFTFISNIASKQSSYAQLLLPVCPFPFHATHTTFANNNRSARRRVKSCWCTVYRLRDAIFVLMLIQRTNPHLVSFSPPLSVSGVQSLYDEVVGRRSAIEETNAAGGRFVREAKV